MSYLRERHYMVFIDKWHLFWGYLISIKCDLYLQSGFYSEVVLKIALTVKPFCQDNKKHPWYLDLLNISVYNNMTPTCMLTTERYLISFIYICILFKLSRFPGKHTKYNQHYIRKVTGYLHFCTLIKCIWS